MPNDERKHNGSHDTVTIDGVVHWSLRTWANVVGFDADGVKYVCRTARKNAVPDEHGRLVSINVDGAHQTFGDLWIIPVNTSPDVVPPYVPGTSSKRSDGRIRFVVLMTDTEYRDLAKTHIVIDLRDVRAARRAAKNAAKSD